MRVSSFKSYRILGPLFTSIGHTWVTDSVGSPRRSPWKQRALALYSYVPVVLIAINIVLTIPFFEKTPIRDIDSFSVVVVQVLLIVLQVYSGFKAIYLIWESAKFKELIAFVEEMLGEISEDPSIKFILLWYGCSMVFPTVSWHGVAIFNHQFVSATQFPFSTETTHGFVAGEIFVASLGYYTAVINFNVDCLLVATLGIFCQHLQQLQGILAGRPDPTKIKAFVERHVKILQAIRKTNECFGLIVLTHVVYTVAVACTLVFAAFKVDDPVFIMMSVVPLLLAGYFQLFLYCHYGQKLTNELEKLSVSVYNNEWYECPVTVRKSLLIIGEVCNAPPVISGCTVLTASMKTYYSTIQESFSYYVVLRNFSTEKLST